jgi:hypothetical protein
VACKASRCRRFIGTLFAPRNLVGQGNDERSQWLADDLENKKRVFSRRKVASIIDLNFFGFAVSCFYKFEKFDFAILLFRDSR